MSAAVDVDPGTAGHRQPDLARRYPELRTLFFVIGTQKASTTWLAKMLEQTPGCHVARGKELHYWTIRAKGVVHSDRIGRQRRKVRESLLRIVLSAPNPSRAAATYGLLRLRLTKLSLLRDPSIENYLAKLMAGWDRQPVVGELTPSYGLLPGEVLRQMAQLLPDTRFVFVMRDPVDRLWSGVKHVYQTDTRRRQDVELDISDHLWRVVSDPDSPHFRLSDYRSTILELEGALAEDRIAYFFHETLRTPQECARLSRFLGLSGIPVRAERRVNPSQHGGLAMPASAEAAALRAFAPTYDFVSERFGSRVPASWRKVPA